MSKKSKTPELIEDNDLDQASGGILIGLLVPAVQKVSEPAAPSTSTTQFSGGIRVATGDVNGD